MAVPSRVYVGITVFGLIASLLTVPYTLLVLSGFRPSALSPVLTFDRAASPGFEVFLVAASILSVGLTVFAWRQLLAGARQDVRRRRARQQVVDESRQYREQRRPPRGPT